MDLRLTFNEDAHSYDRLRPTYTSELYDDVIHYSGLNSSKYAVEIGIGTGQATLPFLKTGCKITAIELGDKLAQFTREKFASYDNLEVINQDFESVELNDNSYDLIYSASAFHWIPKEFGLPKVYRLLKSGGVFAWFSIQPGPSKEHIHIHDEVQKVYSKHKEFFGDKPVPDPEKIQQMVENKRLDRLNTLKEYGFVDIFSKLYYGKRTFTAKDYASLISTYSDHKVMPEDIRIPFLNEIEEVIERNGGVFTLSDSIILGMGRKP